MLFCKPETKKEAISALFPDEPLRTNGTYGAYTAFDGDTPVGKALVLTHGTRCTVLRLAAAENDPETRELLLRACLHFAANRGAYFAQCRLLDLEDTLLSLGFREQDGEFSGDIPTLLAGSCGHCAGQGG